jgi:hypothetical protein
MGLSEAGNEIVQALTGRVPAALKEVGLNIGQTESSADALNKILEKFPYSANKVQVASQLVTNQLTIQKNQTNEVSVALGGQIAKYQTVGETVKQWAYLLLAHPLDFIAGHQVALLKDMVDDDIKVMETEKKMSDSIINDSDRRVKVVGANESDLSKLSDKELENRLQAAKDYDNEYKDLNGKLVTDMENFGKRDFQNEIERIKKLQEARKKALAERLQQEKKFGSELEKIKEEQDEFDLEQSMRTGDEKQDAENIRFAKEEARIGKEQAELTDIIKNGTDEQAAQAQKEWDKNNSLVEVKAKEHEEKITKIQQEEADERKKKLDEQLKKLYELREKNEKAFLDKELADNDLALAKGQESQQQHDKKAIQLQIAADQQQIAELDTTADDYLAKKTELQADIEKLQAQQITDDKKTNDVLRKNAADLADAVVDSYDKVVEGQEEANQTRLQGIQTDMQAQEALAEAGLKNSLAFEERRQAQLQAQQIKLQQQQTKAKELEVFLNAVASFSKDKPITSVASAVALLASVRAEEASISGGSKFEHGGVINDGVFVGRRHSQGGIHIEAEGGEGILSRKDMAAIGGPSGFKELRAAIHEGLPVPGSSLDTAGIERKLDSLQRTMQNLPVTTITADTIGNIVETRVSGLKKEIIKHVPNKKSF